MNENRQAFEKFISQQSPRFLIEEVDDGQAQDYIDPEVRFLGLR